MNIDNVPCIVTACVILHNICEVHGDTFNQTWLLDNQCTLAQPTTHTVTTISTQDAKVIRNKLVTYYQE